MSFWWLDPEFGLFLLFLLTMIWGILLTYAIMIKESIKWILLLQVIASIIYRIAWSRECIERRTISILSNDPPLIPYSVLVGITIFFMGRVRHWLYRRIFSSGMQESSWTVQTIMCAISLGVDASNGSLFLDFHHHDGP